MSLTIDGTNGIETNTDTGKIKVGTDDDLQIYHDGSASYVYDNGTGPLVLGTNNSNIQIKGASSMAHTMAEFKSTEGCEFYYNNSKKAATHASGFKIWSGNLFLDNDTSKAVFGSGDDLQIYHDGSNSYITDSGTGALRINSNDARILNAAGTEDMIRCQENGSVELYYDNSKKFYTSNDGIEVPDGSGFTNRTSGSNKGWYVQHGGTTVARLIQNGTGPEGVLELLNNGTQKILVNGDNGTYYGVNTTVQALSSERRTKENITSIDDTKSWSTLKDIKLYSFSYKNDTNSDTHYGPIVDEIPTDMKVPTPNSDDVGVINTYNSELLLFRAYSTIKQLVAKVEALETKVATLEAA